MKKIFITTILIIFMIVSTSYAYDDLSASSNIITNSENVSEIITSENLNITNDAGSEGSEDNSENRIDNTSVEQEEEFSNDISDILGAKSLRDRNIKIPTMEQFKALTELAVESMPDWEYFYRNYYSRQYCINNIIQKGEINTVQKSEISDGLVKVYNYTATKGKQVNYDEYKEYRDKIDKKIYSNDYCFILGINHKDYGRYSNSDGHNQYANVKISLYNNYCEIDLYYYLTGENWYSGGKYAYFNDYYYIENPAQFMDYVLSMADTFGMETNDEIEYKYGAECDFDKKLINGNPYKVVDRVSFEADIDDSFYDTFIEDIASPDSTVTCVIELIRADTANYLLFYIKGDRGEKLYWDVPHYRWESNWIMFFVDTYCYGNRLTSTNEPSFYIKVEGVTDEDGNIDLTLTVNLGQIGDLPTKIVSKNLTYQSFIDENTSIWDKNRNLGGLFSLTREKMAEENEKIEEQLSKEIDYENYVNYLRKKDEDGNVISDYFVHFIAQVELSIKSNILPDWYNKLGDNVTATIIGITKIIRNNERVDSMILFKGDKGEKWFTNSSIIPSSAMTMMKYTSDEDLSINCTYSELKSFDGEKTVRNTIEYEQMSFEFKYKNDGYLTPDGIDFKIGPKSQHFDEQDIKYIGGGKLSYANLW